MANLSNINGKFVVEQTTGYVGVGTTDPNFLIEAAGANSEIALNSTSASIYRLRSTSSDSFIITKNGVGDRLVIAGNGDATFAGNVILGDTPQIQLGTGNDAQIDHTGSHLFIDNSVGNSYLRNTSTGSIILRNSTGGDIQFDNEFAGNILFNTSNIERMRINSSGQVIINNGDVTIGQDGTYGSDYGMIAFSGTTNGEPRIFGGLTNKTLYLTSGTGGNLNFRTNGTSANKMVIDNDGATTITTDGTVSATTLTLSQTGGIAIDEALGYLNFYSNDPSASSTGGVGGIAVRAETTFNTSYTPSYMSFYTHDTTTNDGTTEGNVTERMRINSLGNVGIGTTSPQSKLHIQTDAAPTDIYLTDGTVGTDNYGGVVRGFSVAGQGGRLQLGTLDNDIYYPTITLLQQGGNVGIGEDNPSGTLDIRPNSNCNYVFDGTSTSGYTTTFNMDDTGLDIGHNSASRSLNLQTNSLDRLTILGGGNVGIGNTSPGAKLTVGSNAHGNATGIEVSAGSSGANIIARDGADHHNWFPYTNGDNYYSAGAHVFRAGIGNSPNYMTITNTGAISFGTSSTAYGTAGQVLTSNGNTTPTWEDASGGSSPWTVSGNNINYTTGAVSIGTTLIGQANLSSAELTVGNNTGSTGISVYSGASNTGSLGFYDGQSFNEAGIRFNHSSEQLDLFMNGQSLIWKMQENSGNSSMWDIRVPDSFGHQTAYNAQLRIGFNSNVTGINFSGTSSGNSNASMTRYQDYGSYSGTYYAKFYNGNTQVGSIRKSGTTGTQFNTSSDYRLKEDLKEFTGLDKISNIPVYDFKWKNTEDRSYGVMAHELQEILPEAVTGEKDGVFEDGEMDVQGVDYSRIVPLLIKSIQELKADNDSLKARIETLENK